MNNLRRITATLAASLALVAAGCGQGNPSAPKTEAEVLGTSATTALGRVDGPLVVAVGDISCPPGSAVSALACDQSATARLAAGYRPRRVLVLGDSQYDSGLLSAYRNSYARTWGAFKSITKPVPGNHEYLTRGASGYYRYFRDQQAGAPGYYAFNVGAWRIYALNSNCDRISCTRENRWLGRNMAAHPHRCSAITMHHPRYSSGEHGSNAFLRPMWRTAMRHHTDLALAGHDHDYERFAKLNAFGEPARAGIASFVSGTGGRGLRDFATPVTGSVVRDSSAFGVLALRLGKAAYAWEYKTVGGEVVDTGTGRCT
ncbi:MAG TPA: metallophosphoesterase [Nocardioidaceae bacterium]|nr:metallophosphoesterase [Nocardioidaceae bacterium]